MFVVGLLLANFDASMPQETASTPVSPAALSRRVAAFLVGVVTTSAFFRIRPVSFQARFIATFSAQRGMTSEYLIRFSGMMWLVAMTRMPCCFADLIRYLPTIM